MEKFRNLRQNGRKLWRKKFYGIGPWYNLALVDRFHFLLRLLSEDFPESGNHLVPHALVGRAVKEENDSTQDAVNDGKNWV